jgi:LPXTG-site transpeptidase (sortase) family protein
LKKKLPIIAIGCVLLIGFCILLYPVVSAMLAKMTQSITISSYKSTVENLSKEEILTLKAKAQEYNESLYGVRLADPFAEGEREEDNKVPLLSVDDVMGYIEIAKIKVYIPIYYGSSEEVLQKGVGHLDNTSLPIGGNSTHTVLTGHRGLPSATLFTDLDQLVEGDVFYLHILNENLAYRVNQIKVVEPDETEDLTIVQGKDYVTLVTCTPYGINTQRLLIRGERIPFVAEQEHFQLRRDLASEVVIVPAAFLSILAVPIVLILLRKIKGRNEKNKRYKP